MRKAPKVSARTKRLPPKADAAMASACTRATRLVELLLRELEEGLNDASEKPSPQWRRLFGSTQSAVVNLQKLVAALGALPVVTEANAEVAPREEPMSREELALLKAWLNEQELPD
ncbi:MAG: hypothetical protein ACKVOE_03795 [Rickettsiales bacterium]